MTFVTQQLVRFAHVDPAGIVFYPRYFEMLNAAVEDYFAKVVGVDFAALHGQRNLGVPTVKLDVTFLAPSRLGEWLDMVLEVGKVGRSSMEISVEMRCAGEARVRVAAVLVCMDLTTGRPLAWPDDLRPEVTASAA
jgi:4-hydroxybenzoyl-CoA thioesterase